MNSVSAPSQYDAPGAFVGAARPQDRGLLRFLKFSDPVLLFIWVIVSTLPVPGATPLRYLCVAYFTAGMVLFARQTLPAFVRAWPMLILPALCLASALWAPSANEAIRKSVFLVLSISITAYLATRMDGRSLIALYFFGEMYGAIMTLLNPNITMGTWTGPYGQKNYLAVHMFILYACALVLMLDKGSNRWIRLAAIPFSAISVFLIIMSQSATTLLMVAGATAALLAHAYLWEPAQRVRHMRTLIIMFGILLSLIAILLAFGLFQIDAAETVLKALGKDSTLTGRTFIWDWGHRIMNEHPWTGVGANGFWRPEVGIARQITTYFYFEGFVRFSFHNSYLENGVQFGYPGYYATIFVAAWGLWCAVRNWLRNQTLINSFFLIISILIIIRSNTEIDLAMELGGTFILFFIAAVRRDEKDVPHIAAPRQPALAGLRK